MAFPLVLDDQDAESLLDGEQGYRVLGRLRGLALRLIGEGRGDRIFGYRALLQRRFNVDFAAQ